MNDQKVTFKFIEFNERRAMRGAEAARVSVKIGDDDEDLIYMSSSDIRKNIKQFGNDPELIKAKQSYCGG